MIFYYRRVSSDTRGGGKSHGWGLVGPKHTRTRCPHCNLQCAVPQYRWHLDTSRTVESMLSQASLDMDASTFFVSLAPSLILDVSSPARCGRGPPPQSGRRSSAPSPQCQRQTKPWLTALSASFLPVPRRISGPSCPLPPTKPRTTIPSTITPWSMRGPQP